MAAALLPTKNDCVHSKDAARAVCPEYIAVSTSTLSHYSDDNLRVCKTTVLFTKNVPFTSSHVV